MTPTDTRLDEIQKVKVAGCDFKSKNGIVSPCESLLSIAQMCSKETEQLLTLCKRQQEAIEIMDEALNRIYLQPTKATNNPVATLIDVGYFAGQARAKIKELLGE